MQERALLTIILVDAATAIVAANIRAVTWSPEFTRAMHRTIRDQAEGPRMSRSEAEAIAAQVYHHYTSAQLAEAALIRTNGGD